MCPVGDSADVEDRLSEIWKGHCMEEGSGCRPVRSAEERGLLAALEVRHFCPFECPQYEKPGKVISEY